MKIKLSRSKWEEIGAQQGWIKMAAGASFSTTQEADPKRMQELYEIAHDDFQDYKAGQMMILSPELHDSPEGRAFLKGWNDASHGRAKSTLGESDILELTKANE